MPEVSVIIPNYNHAPYLDRRIRSVLSQTYEDFEVIILDDCSNDDSKQIIDKYRDHPKVEHILYNTKNSGNTFEQWSKGIAIAKGNLIWIAESDDWCDADLLQELVIPMIDDTSLALSFCQSVVVTPRNEILLVTNAPFLSQKMEGGLFLQTKMLGMNHIINASAVIFRKSKFENIDAPYKEMKYCGDWLFWSNLCLLGNVFISGRYLNYFVRHENSVAPAAMRNGYSFLEGNKIFHFILDKVNVSAANKLQALRIRLAMYNERKHLFPNHEVNEQVLNAMFELDPVVKSMIRRQRWVRAGKKVMQKLYIFLHSIYSKV